MVILRLPEGLQCLPLAPVLKQVKAWQVVLGRLVVEMQLRLPGLVLGRVKLRLARVRELAPRVLKHQEKQQVRLLSLLLRLLRLQKTKKLLLLRLKVRQRQRIQAHLVSRRGQLGRMVILVQAARKELRPELLVA